MTQIDLSHVKNDIKRHLSAIGKRISDKDGVNIFSNITASTAEDPIFDKYTSEAIQNIAGILNIFVEDYSDSAITLDASRWNAKLVNALQDAVLSYVTLYTVYHFLAMTHPDLAGKYAGEASAKIDNIKELAFHKKQPVNSRSSYADVSCGVNTSLSIDNIDIGGAQQGSTFEVSVQKEPDGATFPVMFYSDSDNVVSINEQTGTATIIGEGETVIEARFAGSKDYIASTDSITCNVTKYVNISSSETKQCDYNVINQYDEFHEESVVDGLVFRFNAHQGNTAILTRFSGSRLVLYRFALIKAEYVDSNLYKYALIYKHSSSLPLGEIQELLNMNQLTEHEYDYIYIWIPGEEDNGRIKLEYAGNPPYLYNIHASH